MVIHNTDTDAGFQALAELDGCLLGFWKQQFQIKQPKQSLELITVTCLFSYLIPSGNQCCLVDLELMCIQKEWCLGLSSWTCVEVAALTPLSSVHNF